MRASLKWLNEYVNITEEPRALAERLTMAGIPVATVHEQGKEINDVVTGKIVEISPHVNANKLVVCKIDIGSKKTTIVTGAENVRVGHIVPVALPGCVLPGGKKIEVSQLRGVASYGMLCSAEELGMDNKVIAPELRDGIYILPSDTPIGIDAKTAIGLDDIIFEFEITPNRADCFSVIGLAREIAALTGETLKKPLLSLKELPDTKAGSMAAIQIDNPELCPRFTARILTDITIMPSPTWMQHRLQAAGMRPINNVVDVTNFVMLEMGVPMHAYDYNLLSKHSITVRNANQGEKLTTLDGIKRELSSDMLVIADAVQAVGIAGVMGGLTTEVTANTQTVLLEAAAFQGASVRKTSRSLGLRSEASGRFERGVDVSNLNAALDRAAGLLQNMGACNVCSDIIDNYPRLTLPHQFSFLPKEINAYLGTEIQINEMIDILNSLEFIAEVHDINNIRVTVPSWRSDVTAMADISEEIARMHGFNKILPTTPRGAMRRGSQSSIQSITDYIKTTLCSIGFNEMISFSFSSPIVMEKLNVTADMEIAKMIQLKNPITEDFPCLRTTLLGGIINAIIYNLSRKNDNLKLFELGSVFIPKELPLTDLPQEPLMLCGAMVGQRTEHAWNKIKEDVDFYDTKGAVEEILHSLGIDDYSVQAGNHFALHPGKTAIFTKNEQILAYVGELHPQVLAAFGLTKKIYIFEMPIATMAAQTELIARYRPLPKMPSINRDLAVILQSDVPANKVMRTIWTYGGDLLESVKLFDMYIGEQVPAGYKSLAYSLVFRADNRTLIDDEVDALFSAIVAGLEKEVAAKLR